MRFPFIIETIKRGLGDGLIVQLDLHARGPVIQQNGLERRHQVGGKPAQRHQLDRFEANHGVKPDPDPIAKHAPLRIKPAGQPAHIDRLNECRRQGMDIFFQVMRQSHAISEIIAAPHGEHAQRRVPFAFFLGAHQPIEYLIYRPISTRRDHRFVTFRSRLVSQIRGMPGLQVRTRVYWRR